MLGKVVARRGMDEHFGRGASCEPSAETLGASEFSLRGVVERLGRHTDTIEVTSSEESKEVDECATRAP